MLLKKEKKTIPKKYKLQITLLGQIYLSKVNSHFPTLLNIDPDQPCNRN